MFPIRGSQFIKQVFRQSPRVPVLKLGSMRYRLALVIFTACTLYCCEVSGQVKSAPPINFRIQIVKSAEAKPEATYSRDRSVVLRVVDDKSSEGAEVQLFDVAHDKPLGPQIELRARRITALAVSPDNSTVATAIGNFSNDWGEVCIWSGTSGKQIAKYKATGDSSSPYLGEVARLSFSDDGHTVVVVSGRAGGK